MDRQNTTLDDIASIIGFSATLRLSAWYGNGNNLYVPTTVEEGQVLVLLIGRSAAERLSQEFGGDHLAVPRIVSYDEDCRRQRVATMLSRGFSTREVSRIERVSERRIQQICRELEQVGIIAPLGPSAENDCWAPPGALQEKAEGEFSRRKPPGKRASEKCQEKGPQKKRGVKSQTSVITGIETAKEAPVSTVIGAMVLQLHEPA
ncbi:hypothetical protein [Delftia tsuruhatensis]|uniref:hypothetical protein n=1 Tax=Delftia tsuruhatensis TaxID=180282 RepID=UPI003A887A59